MLTSELVNPTYLDWACGAMAHWRTPYTVDAETIPRTLDAASSTHPSKWEMDFIGPALAIAASSHYSQIVNYSEQIAGLFVRGHQTLFSEAVMPQGFDQIRLGSAQLGVEFCATPLIQSAVAQHLATLICSYSKPLYDYSLASLPAGQDEVGKLEHLFLKCLLTDLQQASMDGEDTVDGQAHFSKSEICQIIAVIISLYEGAVEAERANKPIDVCLSKLSRLSPAVVNRIVSLSPREGYDGVWISADHNLNQSICIPSIGTLTFELGEDHAYNANFISETIPRGYIETPPGDKSLLTSKILWM